MTTISKISARQILDSRGNPTIEVDAYAGSLLARAAVPSGASTGVNEALELRDGGTHWSGKGVEKAVKNVKEIIAGVVEGRDPVNQREIDELMIEKDGTENKESLGANAMLGVSMAVCRLGAQSKQLPLYRHLRELAGSPTLRMPLPQMNVINGGRHAGQENDIQEHMIAPVGAKNFHEGVMMAVESYHSLKSILKKKFGPSAILLGDEGGFVPPLKNVRERLEVMTQAVKEAGYENEMKFAVDAAASEFYNDGTYTLGTDNFTGGELVDFYADLSKTFPIYSIEDGHDEEDWAGFTELTSKLGSTVQVVGDDLLCTNPMRIAKAIKVGAVNALLLKVNQIGTVSEALDAHDASHKNGWKTVVSHRSGETEDSFIGDLVVGIGAGQSKFGAPARSDRNAKYNQLLRIEEELGNPVYGPER